MPEDFTRKYPRSKREEFEDILEEAEVKNFLHRAETEMFPQMRGNMHRLE